MIDPGASITVTLAFSPTSGGAFTGSLEIDSTGGNKIVGISGNAGVAGRPADNQ